MGDGRRWGDGHAGESWFFRLAGLEPRGEGERLVRRMWAGSRVDCYGAAFGAGTGAGLWFLNLMEGSFEVRLCCCSEIGMEG